MIEPIPFALSGFLDVPAAPGEAPGTASWRMVSSPTECSAEEEAVIPCTTTVPDLAHALLSECQPGDLLRVTGHLTLPGNADGHIRMHVDTLEVLWEAPVSEPQEEHDLADESGERTCAIQALAEALTGLARGDALSEQPDIRINIGPLGINALDDCHSIDLSTAKAHKLADAVDAMLCQVDSRCPTLDGVLDPQALADLTDHFDNLDLVEVTRAVLEETRAENRRAVTKALDDMFGDIPVPGVDETEQ